MASHPLTAGQVAAYRQAIGVGPDFTVDPEVMERLEDFFDVRAGRYRLSPEERWLHRACRQRFGLFCPTSPQQVSYMRQLRAAQRMRVPVVELWAELLGDAA